MMKRSFLAYGSWVIAAAFLSMAAGCGYTTRSLLPVNFKSIYVENFKNSIKITAEQSNLRMYRGYTPGMEVGLTKAVIDKFLSDGNLKIATASDADLVLKAELVDFKRDALRYDANDNVEEYRVKIFVNLELEDAKSGKSVWKETYFAGEATYRTGGSLAKDETAGVKEATADLARRITERTVEAW